MSKTIKTTILISAALLLLTTCASTPPIQEQRESYIVQAKDLMTATSAVRSVGGEITHELGIIRAVGADLTPSQVERLRAMDGLSIHDNSSLEVSAVGGTVAILPVDHDSWIKEGIPQDNLSGDLELTAKGKDGDSARVLYRFDLSTLQPGIDVTSATVSLWVTNDDSSPVEVHRITEAWDEATVTWNSSQNHIDSQPTVSFVPSSKDQFISFDLSSLVDEWVRGATPNYGIMLIQTGSKESKYTSRGWSPENRRPYLRVVYSDGTPSAVVSALVGASELHSSGIKGSGVTVAVIDTGHWSHNAVNQTTDGTLKVPAQYDAISNALMNTVNYTADTDLNGHGTVVESLIVSSATDSDGKYLGIAPDAELVSIRAFDANGMGTYADVIRGVDFAVTMKNAYGIRILNCSFSAEVRSHYWEDPLNQAIMAAWQAGIVVVASAGNSGPDPMTVGVPGNNPYVITVGAMSDGYTPDVPYDDYLVSFSATGPTYEGFIKPDVVAPGGHISTLMPPGSTIATQHPEFRDVGDYFIMSGTSQAAAIVSGVVALVLDYQPSLTPDDVKCRLMASAAPAVDGAGDLKYSLFQQGAGMVNAKYAAKTRDASGCANSGLDVDNDLADIEHYIGPANQAADGTFYLTNGDGDGTTWDGSYVWDSAYLWNDAYFWNDAYLWNDAYFWNDAFFWNDAYFWNDYLAETMTINVWVPQE